jgi:hypothetical protein
MSKKTRARPRKTPVQAEPRPKSDEDKEIDALLRRLRKLLRERRPTIRVRAALYPDTENGGYTAVLTAMPGCITEGDTREETLASLREALEGMLLCTSGTFELLEGGFVEEVDL